MDFGGRLKKARNARGLTQVEAAEKVGIDDTTISKYENNKSEPDNETLNKLSTLYNCSIDYLMGRTDKPDGIAAAGSVIDPFKIFELLDQYSDDEILQRFHHAAEGNEIDKGRAKEFISYARYLKNKGG